MATHLTFYGSRMAQIVFSCFFSIAIIVLNIVLIASILFRKQLRENSKYVFVLLLAVSDFYIGIFVIPLLTHTMVTQVIDFPCMLTKALYGSGYIHMAMSCLAVVFLNLDYLFQQTLTSYKATTRILITLILAVFFFFLPIAVLVPILVNGQSDALSSSCFLSLEVSYARMAVILSYWVPAGCVVITTIIVIVVHLKSRRQQTYLQYPGAPPQTATPPVVNQSNPTDIILAAVFTVALNFPGQILTIVGVTCNLSYCDWYFIMITVFGYLSDTKAFLLPLVWFLNRDFRNAVSGRTNIPVAQPFVGQAPLYSNYTQPQGQILSNPVAQGYVYPNSGYQASTNEKQ